MWKLVLVTYPAQHQQNLPLPYPPPASEPMVAQYGTAPGGYVNQPVGQQVPAFYFDGGAGSYLGTGTLAFLLTLFTLGLGTPWAICLRYSWRTKHTYVNGHRLRFTGSGGRLFGNWIKWFLLTIVTLGVYSFWVVPRLTKWIVENQEFDPTYR